MPRLHFVQELPAGSSKKEKELERAKARAHAASVSFQSHHPKKLQILTRPERGLSANNHGVSPTERHQSSLVPDFGNGLPATFDPSPTGQAQYVIHTPPDSPQQRRDSVASQTSQALPSNILTPPDSDWSGTIVDDGDSGVEHVEDIVTDEEYMYLDSSSSASTALIPSSNASHTVYQINPHAQYTDTSQFPWTQSTAASTPPFNLDSIPHDLLGTRRDPFDCIPHRHAHSASVSAVTDYHAQIMAPNHAPIYKIFNVTNVYTAYYFELLSHPDFLYTGVASVHAIIDHLRRKPDEPVGPSGTVLKHIGTAMGRLRKRLGRFQKLAREKQLQDLQQHQYQATAEQEDISADTIASEPDQSSSTINNPILKVDDMTIMTVLFLAVATRAINDLESHEIHKRTIASLVAARGGLSNLNGHDGLARCTLMQWESFWALNTGVTIFPEVRPPYVPQYPTIPELQTANLLTTKIASLPSGFQALSNQRRMALDVIEVLSRTARAHIDQALHGTIVTPSDVFRTKPRKFQDFWEACTCLGAPEEMYMYSCADQRGFDNRDEAGGVTVVMLPNLEKLIVLALLLYCLHTFSPMRAVTAVYNGSRMKLTTDLPRRVRRQPRALVIDDTIKVESEEDVLLWTAFVLADSWRAANDSLLPQGKLIMRDIRARFVERTESWERVETVLKMSFWSEAFLSRCRQFWMWSEEERMVRFKARWTGENGWIRSCA